MKRNWYHILIIALAFPIHQMKAQEAPIRFGLGYTGNAYRGDLTQESGSLWRAEPGANFSVDVDRAKRLRPQLNLGFGGFTEQADAPLPVSPERVQPNSFVRTSFFYADVRLLARLNKNRKFSPYLSAGAGLFSFQPRDAQGNFLGENLFSRLPDEDYLTLIGSLPLSAGLEWRLNPTLSLGAEYTYRLTGSDYLDNIGQLGTAAGADRLHALQLKLLFSVRPQQEVPALPLTEPLLLEKPEPELEPAPPVYYRHKDGQLRRRPV